MKWCTPDDSSLTYGQVKAAATGDILLLEHANVSLSADAFSRLHASFQRARERDKQEASLYRHQAHQLENFSKRYQEIEQLVAEYTGEHPFMTTRRFILEKKEERRELITAEVLLAVNNNYLFHKIGYWRGVPIFMKVNVSSNTPYMLAFNDPHRGIEVQCHPAWLEKDNQWRFGWKMEQFFEGIATAMEEDTERIKNKLQKAEEFEKQARTLFPQQQPWQTVLARKQELDRYIDCAAHARTEEDLQMLAQMRQHLLATVPKELMERPKPKNTALFVLPPRNPNAAQEATVFTTQIEVAGTEAREQTIEEVVQTIKQSLVGSNALVSFGNLEHIQKIRKEKKGKSAHTQPQLVDCGQGKKQRDHGKLTRPQSSSKRSVQEQERTLWDVLTQELQPERTPGYVANLTPVLEPQQLTLL